MKVLADSSAWIDFAKGHPSNMAVELRRMLGGEVELCTCGLVVTEVVQGLHRPKDRERMLDLLGRLTFLELEGIEPYLRAADLYRQLRSRGKTVRSVVDCLVAITAEAHGCWLLGRDRDLDLILGSGLVRCAWWPASGGDLISEGPSGPTGR